MSSPTAAARGAGPTTSGTDTDGRLADIDPREIPRIVVSGVFMGTADLVPGVSGGTMALALGIYRRLLAAIASINLDLLKAIKTARWRQALDIVHWRFLASLGFGIVLALVIMGRVFKLPQLTLTSPKPVYSVFFGLVLASTVILARRVSRWDVKAGVSLPIGAVVGLLIVTLVPVDTPYGAPFMFLYGAIAIIAMILPGISGSFILLVLGKYAYVIEGVLHLDLAIALPFAAGCAVGIMAFSRVLGRLLDRFHDPMIAGLAGLLLGSLYRIWPYQNIETVVVRDKPRIISAEPFVPPALEVSTLLLVVLGVVLVGGVEVLAIRRSRLSRFKV